MNSFYTSVYRHANDILFRGYINGELVKKKYKFKPTLFCQSPKRESDWVGLDGTEVEPVEQDSMYDAKKFMDQYKDVSGFKIFGNTNYVAQFITKMWPDDISFDISLIKRFNIDIEVDSEDGFPHPDQADSEVISIVLKNTHENNFQVWGLKPYDLNESPYDNVDYHLCRDEIDLLQKFVLYWVKNYPDIVTGWYIKSFDIPYLYNRIVKVLTQSVADKLSPWGIVHQNETTYFNNTITTYDILGVQQMDYLDLFKKFGYSYGPQETYKLDNIAYVVLGEKKLSYEEYGSLNALYRENPQKFITYNIKDVDLVERIDDKMGLINLALTMAYRGGVNYSDTFGTTAIWDSIIYRVLNKNKIAIWQNNSSNKVEYPGGYVKEPQIGMHEWVASFDLNSLYPNLIIQYNMSPETIVNDERGYGVNVQHCLNNDIVNDTEYSMAANGVYFRKDKLGILPKLVASMYDERVLLKRKMLDAKQRLETEGKSYAIEREISIFENQQTAIKILLNSLYGAIGNRFFRYFDIRIAEGITLSGQLSILTAEKAINDYLKKALGVDKDFVIAIDTDSVYITLDDMVQKVCPNKTKEETIQFLDKVCSQAIEPIISNAFQRLSEKMGAYDNRMVMKREALADRGIWTAKKRYILNVYNNEGVQYTEPKIKIMGIEAVKSSTPEICRKKFKEVFKVIINGTNKELQDFVADFKEEFRKSSPEDVAFPRGVTDVDSKKDSKFIYSKGTPIHVRGSLLYNDALKRLTLDKKYSTIKNGDKIKFVYLTVPNPIRENVISFSDILPPEFGLHSYIDYEKQFDKTFAAPLKIITDSIGWEIEKVYNLEDFFG